MNRYKLNKEYPKGIKIQIKNPFAGFEHMRNKILNVIEADIADNGSVFFRVKENKFSWYLQEIKIIK